MEGDDSLPVAHEGNGTRLAFHRDSVMAVVLVGCILALSGLGVLSAMKPPADWNILNRVADVLAVTISNILVGHFALSKSAK